MRGALSYFGVVISRAILLSSALLLGGCGVLSTHQSPRLLGHREKAWTAGFGAGSSQGCTDEGLQEDCILAYDPYFGYRLGWVAGIIAGVGIQKSF